MANLAQTFESIGSKRGEDSRRRDGYQTGADIAHRQLWAAKRKALENARHKHSRYGRRPRHRWMLFEWLIRLFESIIRFVGLYNMGKNNAKSIGIREIKAVFPDLPSGFHNYEILQLTDLHLDLVEGIADIICEKIKGICCDLCVLTGDYRALASADTGKILTSLSQIAKSIHAKDGILAILGNHDTVEMAASMDDMGIRLLANETVTIKKDRGFIKVSGVDDPHCYYTDQALETFAASGDGFKVALVHTPELHDVAASEKYHMYLCGHTHGGQICLPGGIPIFTHSFACRKFSRGLWRFGKMTGYTSSGCGSSGIPVRFNCAPEIARIRLMRADSSV